MINRAMYSHYQLPIQSAASSSSSSTSSSIPASAPRLYKIDYMVDPLWNKEPALSNDDASLLPKILKALGDKHEDSNFFPVAKQQNLASGVIYIAKIIKEAQFYQVWYLDISNVMDGNIAPLTAHFSQALLHVTDASAVSELPKSSPLAMPRTKNEDERLQFILTQGLNEIKENIDKNRRSEKSQELSDAFAFISNKIDSLYNLYRQNKIIFYRSTRFEEGELKDRLEKAINFDLVFQNQMQLDKQIESSFKRALERLAEIKDYYAKHYLEEFTYFEKETLGKKLCSDMLSIPFAEAMRIFLKGFYAAHKNVLFVDYYKLNVSIDKLYNDTPDAVSEKILAVKNYDVLLEEINNMFIAFQRDMVTHPLVTLLKKNLENYFSGLPDKIFTINYQYCRGYKVTVNKKLRDKYLEGLFKANAEKLRKQTLVLINSINLREDLIKMYEAQNKTIQNFVEQMREEITECNIFRNKLFQKIKLVSSEESKLPVPNRPLQLQRILLYIQEHGDRVAGLEELKQIRMLAHGKGLAINFLRGPACSHEIAVNLLQFYKNLSVEAFSIPQQLAVYEVGLDNFLEQIRLSQQPASSSERSGLVV